MTDVVNHNRPISVTTLNRLSWLRPSHVFLNAIISSPVARWIVFHNGQPLVATFSNKPDGYGYTPAFLSTEDVRRFLGPEPFFGQAKNVGQLVTESGDPKHSPTASARHRLPSIVFLGYGVDKRNMLLSPSNDPNTAIKRLVGTPYFAMDMMELSPSQETLTEFLRTNSLARRGWRLSWSEPTFMTELDSFYGGLYATARSMTNWNQSNKFCPACGSPTYSMWGGWKRSCSSFLPWAEKARRKPCPTIKGIHNFCHPRTDMVVVVVVTDKKGDRILLGRGRKYLAGSYYSTFSGCAEPGETFEATVAREVFEKTGLSVWDVKYASGKQWPYPSNLMIGFYARADAEQPIRIDLDSELADVRWYTRAEVRSVLKHSAGSGYESNIYRSRAQGTGDHPDSPSMSFANSGPDVSLGDSPFMLPPKNLLPGALIRRWTYNDPRRVLADDVRQEVRQMMRSNL